MTAFSLGSSLLVSLPPFSLHILLLKHTHTHAGPGALDQCERARGAPDRPGANRRCLGTGGQ